MYRAPYAEALQFRCILCTVYNDNKNETETEDELQM